MEILVVIVNIFVQYLHFGLVIPCKDLYTRQPINGFHCQTNLNTMVMHQTEFPQCAWRCLSENTCRYINHNFANGQCELGLGQCESLRPNGTFSVMAFGPLGHDCLRWGPSVEPGRVPFKVLNTYYSYVAKIISENNVPIGRFNIQSGKFWANKKVFLWADTNNRSRNRNFNQEWRLHCTLVSLHGGGDTSGWSCRWGPLGWRVTNLCC